MDGCVPAPKNEKSLTSTCRVRKKDDVQCPASGTPCSGTRTRDKSANIHKSDTQQHTTQELNCARNAKNKSFLSTLMNFRDIKLRFSDTEGIKSILSVNLPKLHPPNWLIEPEFITPENSETNTSAGTLPDSGNTRGQHLKIKSCHQHADSLLSTDSGFTNYRGFLNLCIVLLVLAAGRVALENVIKYGILVDPVKWLGVFLHDPYNWPCMLLLVASNIFILFCYFVELQLIKGTISENFGWYLHTLNELSILFFPAAVILYIHPSPLFSSITLAIYTCICLKTISYQQVNEWLRCNYFSSDEQFKRKRKRLKSSTYTGKVTSDDVKPENGHFDDEEKQQYPDNLNTDDLYYFIVAPTLCYELNFPRSARIRKRFLLKRITEMVFLTGLLLSLVQQWIVPTVRNSMQPFENMDVPKTVERLLKLALPNHLIWLIFFYWFFHSCLNVTAELLKFGDRVFYRDWWNAESISYFWQNWNIPVHKWATRHLYKPMMKKGYPKLYAKITVFLLSAFFHEYLLSVPLKMFKVWAFLSMLTQIPLAYVTEMWIHGKSANILVWLTLIAGQPIAILMYYHDYYILSIN